MNPTQLSRERRADEQPYLPLAMAAKVSYDVFTKVRLAREEWAQNRRFCQYGQRASLASIASLALALPEALAAARRLFSGGAADRTRAAA